MKIAIVVCLALLSSACTTVRTYDREGTLTGSCEVSGLFHRGGECIGYANGEGKAQAVSAVRVASPGQLATRPVRGQDGF